MTAVTSSDPDHSGTSRAPTSAATTTGPTTARLVPGRAGMPEGIDQWMVSRKSNRWPQPRQRIRPSTEHQADLPLHRRGPFLLGWPHRETLGPTIYSTITISCRPVWLEMTEEGMAPEAPAPVGLARRTTSSPADPALVAGCRAKPVTRGRSGAAPVRRRSIRWAWPKPLVQSRRSTGHRGRSRDDRPPRFRQAPRADACPRELPHRHPLPPTVRPDPDGAGDATLLNRTRLPPSRRADPPTTPLPPSPADGGTGPGGGGLPLVRRSLRLPQPHAGPWVASAPTPAPTRSGAAELYAAAELVREWWFRASS